MDEERKRLGENPEEVTVAGRLRKASFFPYLAMAASVERTRERVLDGSAQVWLACTRVAGESLSVDSDKAPIGRKRRARNFRHVDLRNFAGMFLAPPTMPCSRSG
jgi:hypothetical protein